MVHSEGLIYLKGVRIISTFLARIPKYLVPILAKIHNEIDTNKMEMKIIIQD